MDIILLAIFSYAIYRMALSYNITPWKWIGRYVIVFFVSFIALVVIVASFNGLNIVKDIDAMEKAIEPFSPMILLYEFVLFFFFRNRIIRYVHILDQIDKTDNNNMPNPPTTPTKEQKDFSYFR